ncbi:MAG: hypothetical protein HQK58_05120 [Deltaproteobacteria bacterium]|nr:hypothetical protein [Deltaproteobacteria bacterium]
MSENNKVNDNITLILEESRQAKAFKAGYSFFKDELIKVSEIIAQLINKLDKPDDRRDCRRDVYQAEESTPDSDRPGPQHNCIGVFGPRGVGKTSFMKSIEGYLRELENKEGSKCKNLSSKLHFLDPIDPSMLEDTEYFLITLISLICQEVEKAACEQTSCCHQSRDVGSRQDHLLSWNKSLSKLAQHLVALSPNAYGKFIEDTIVNPEIFAQDALMLGRSGKNLAKEFRKFVSASITLLVSFHPGLSALVVLIDDVDTAFQRGWKVLETVRKYLVTPKLIVIISGDLELYDMVIRINLVEQAKILRFGDNRSIPSEDMKRLTDFGRQYQLKLLPLENRIHLPSTYENLVARENGRKIVVKKNTRSTPVSLASLFALFCQKIYKWPAITEDNALNVYNQFTRVFPTSNRELIRLVDMVLWPCMEINIHEEQGGKEQGNDKSKTEHQIMEIRRRVITALVDLYQGLLSERGINVQALRNAVDQPVERGLFMALTSPWREDNSKEAIEEFYRFQPRGEYHRKNIILLTIQAALNVAYDKRFERIIDYWFLLADMYLSCEQKTDFKGQELNDYLNHLHYEGDEPPDIYARKVAWEHDQNNATGAVGSRVGPGYMPVLTDSTDRFQLLSEMEIKKSDGTYPWLNFLLKCNEIKELKGVVEIEGQRDAIDKIAPIWVPTVVDFRSRADKLSNAVLDVFSFNVVHNRVNYPYVSFYRGLAMLGELMKSYRGGMSSVAEVFGIWRQQRSYLSPSKEETGDGTPLDSTYRSSPDERLEADPFFVWLEYWLVRPPTEVPSVPVLGGIWRRTHFNLRTQADALTRYEWSAGAMLRRATLAFLNAILVEEIIWRNAEQGELGDLLINLDRRNLIRTYAIFGKNIRLINHKVGESWVKKYPFFNYWVNCPLLLMLLSPEDQSLIIEVVGGQTSVATQLNKLNARPITWTMDKYVGKDSNRIDVKVDDKYSLYTLLCSLGPTPPIEKDTERKKDEEVGKNNLVKFIIGGKTVGKSSNDDKQ